MRLRKKTRVAGAWGPGTSDKTSLVFISPRGRGGQGSGEEMLFAVSFETHHGFAMLRRT